MKFTDEQIEQFKKIAQQRTWYDQFLATDYQTCVFDFSDTNVDDAYEGGVRDGRVSAYREILELLGIEYTIEED